VRRRKYDWTAIREYCESGHTIRECQQRFGFSDGAWHTALKRGDVVTGSPPKPRGVTRARVARALEDGLPVAEIARELGIAKSTVCFHLRGLGILPVEDFARRYDWSEIRNYYDAGNSMTECRRRLGFTSKSWSDAVQRGAIKPRPRLEPLDSVLVLGRRRSRFHLKNRLLAERLKQPCCEECGIGEWHGRSLALELHHINGDGLDNRLENLLLLCPNCHSQTDSWGGRNKGRRAA
jgi:5-methylcytosine-specific restriction endonuclease McrA